MSETAIAPFEVRASGAALGADVLAADLGGITPAQVQVLRQALVDHHVLRFRGYDLDDVQFTRLAEHLGELQPSPKFSRTRAVYVAASPMMTVVSNIEEAGRTVGDAGDGELNWHTDLGFTDHPSALTMLLAREVPGGGGDTSFANMYRAYEALPDDVRACIADLRCKHQASHNAQGGRRPGYLDIETDDPREMPGPVHPLVRTHPRSGRKALYLGRRFGAYIQGLPLARSEALLDTLWRHAALPENTWTQRWQVGDLVIWDNRCTMHRRDSFAGQGRRRLHRLMTRGERPV